MRAAELILACEPFLHECTSLWHRMLASFRQTQFDITGPFSGSSYLDLTYRLQELFWQSKAASLLLTSLSYFTAYVRCYLLL